MSNSEYFDQIADALRYQILKMTHAVGSGHPTSCFSAVELMTVLFFKYLRYDPQHPEEITNDRVIFSKGHASALLYALYNVAGILSEKDLAGYRQFNSPLEGHPTTRFKYVEAATGSLGQGLAVAAGEAWAIRRLYTGKSSGHTVSKSDFYQTEYDATIRLPFSIPRVFVLMGDGETAEGSVWEAVSWAAHAKLNNLITVVDVNRLGQTDQTMLGRDADTYRRRFEAFGCGVIVIDGHDWSQIDAAYEKAICYKDGPSVIIADTVKGHGLPVWEDKNGWHNKMLPDTELQKALAQFKPVKPSKAVIQKPDQPSDVYKDIGNAKFPVNALNLHAGSYPRDKKITTKLAFGQALTKLGKYCPSLLVLDGDVSNSLHTDLFAAAYPDRFLQMFIAEQNMAGVAVGLAKFGFLPAINTFAAFLSRAHDQFRMMPLTGVNVLVNGSYAGVSVGRDGPSQFGLDDLAIFRGIYNSIVLYPSDPYQTEKLVLEMLQARGMVYIRTTREPTPVIYTAETVFTIGGSFVFPASPPVSPTSSSQKSSRKNSKKTKSPVVTVVAAGITVHHALTAQQELAATGIPVNVIDCYSVKPIDKQTLLDYADKSEFMVIVEDHCPQGGLADAVREALSGKRIKTFHLAVGKLPMSGSARELMRYEEIDSQEIKKLIEDHYSDL